MNEKIQIKSSVPVQVVRIVQGRSYVPKFAAPAAYYTHFVAFSKRFLWVLVALVVAAVLWIASSNTGDKGSRLVFSSVSQTEDAQPVMTKPHYQGVDVNGQPYTVIAEKAIQKDQSTVMLESIRADMMQRSGQWMALNAAYGEINLDTRKMYLSGGVSMFADGGYEFRSSHAHVDVQRSVITSDSHVEGQGPPGTLTADRFDADGEKRVIRFNGSVRMILYR